jgi:hypothetical protein
MKRIILAALLLATGCNVPGALGPKETISQPRVLKQVPSERPTVNLPLALRQSNWTGSAGMGSCTWATMVSLLRWQGHYDVANWVRQNYGDGACQNCMPQKMDRAGIRYAYVTNGDVKFLEWACSTRRGFGIAINGGEHMVALVHLDAKWAALLDNNNIENFIWVPRETLIAEWKASNGWAITPVYSPAAPLPQ